VRVVVAVVVVRGPLLLSLSPWISRNCATNKTGNLFSFLLLFPPLISHIILEEIAKEVAWSVAKIEG